MVKLANTLDSGSSVRKDLGVQVPLWAMIITLLQKNHKTLSLRELPTKRVVLLKLLPVWRKIYAEAL